MPISINSLAGAYRQRDNPRWSRAHHIKILEKMHKGVSLRALRALRQGKIAKAPSDAAVEVTSGADTALKRSRPLLASPATSPMGARKKRLPLYMENDEITECMRRRGKASLLKHPAVSVEHRMAGRDLIVPSPETLLDVNMFISNTGNIAHKHESEIGLGRSIMHSMDEMAHELERLDELIHHQAAGTSTNNSISRFRAHFRRANLFYSMAGVVTSVSKDDPGLYRSRPRHRKSGWLPSSGGTSISSPKPGGAVAGVSKTNTGYSANGNKISSKTSSPRRQRERNGSSSKSIRSDSKKNRRDGPEVGTVERYLRSALHDICIALKLEPTIAPAYFNRALYLRKLRCHAAALGDVAHSLVLLSNDIGDNESAKIKYMSLAGLLEREVGLFVESGLEYQRVKMVIKEQLKLAEAKRRKLAAARALKHQEAMKAAGLLNNSGGGIFAGKTSLWKAGLSKKVKTVTQLHAMPGMSTGGSEGQSGGMSMTSMLSVVHQATGGKHLKIVHKAKKKFLHGLLSPIAQSMAGTVPGQRSPSQIDRIMKFVHSTHSDDLMSLGTATLRKVCQWIEHTSCAAGRHVFRQGDPQDAFYVLASGMATVMVMSPKIGHEVPVKQLHPGDSFGKIYFPTMEEIEALEQRTNCLSEDLSEDKGQGNQRLIHTDGSVASDIVPEALTTATEETDSIHQMQHTPSRGKLEHSSPAPPMKRQSSVLTKAWATEHKLGSTSSTRRAGIYANRHCELLILRWSHLEHKKEDTKEGNTEESSEAVARKEAIREFQNHTILRRFNILRRCHVFKFLRNKDLERLATIGSIHSWHQGKVLVRQDEVMARVIVIFRGVCRVQKRRPRAGLRKITPSKFSPTGQGEDPLDVGMLWKQQYQQHLKARSDNLTRAIKRQHSEGEYEKEEGEWIKVGAITAGDICCEMVLLNPNKSTPSPVQIVADTSVDALVFSLGELKPFLSHGVFSGRTRNLLVDSVGTNVPCEMKIHCNMAAQERWKRQKKVIVDSHVWGHRHPGPQPVKRDVTELPSRSTKAMLAGRVSWVRRG